MQLNILSRVILNTSWPNQAHTHFHMNTSNVNKTDIKIIYFTLIVYINSLIIYINY